MDILRNIEKKILNIANNNTNSTSEINNLKKDIKLYLDIFDKREELKREKKGIYEELYDNKRKAYHISYENYLSDKKDLMNDIIKEKTKGAIRKYLECKYEDEEAAVNIPAIYTYENIRLPNNREDFDMPSAPPALHVQTAQPSVPINSKIDNIIPDKPDKPDKHMKKVVAKSNEKECPDGKEINLVTKRCVNVCKDGQIRNPKTGKCVASAKKTKVEPKKEPAEAKEKECPEGKEINPVTKRCVNVCKEGQVRNPETGKCVGAKKK